jgi:hypothetical protein
VRKARGVVVSPRRVRVPSCTKAARNAGLAASRRPFGPPSVASSPQPPTFDSFKAISLIAPGPAVAAPPFKSAGHMPYWLSA